MVILPGEKALGSTFFLNSDWKIRPYNASHRLIINGNFYSADGTDPFLDPLGTFTVRIMQQVSSLVDSTVQQLSEIEYASYNGGVTVDADSSYSGTDYPVGTPRSPVNNLLDALDIAADRGFTVFYILGDITVGDSLDFTQMSFIGESIDKSEITIESDANVDSCEFYEATITGTLDGQCKVKDCRILDVNYISGVVELCILSGEITLGGGQKPTSSIVGQELLWEFPINRLRRKWSNVGNAKLQRIHKLEKQKRDKRPSKRKS